MKLASKALILITVPLLFNIGVVGALSFFLKQADETNNQYWKSQDVIAALEGLRMDRQAGEIAEKIALDSGKRYFRNLRESYRTDAVKRTNELHDLRDQGKEQANPTSIAASETLTRVQNSAARPFIMAALTINVALTSFLGWAFYKSVGARLLRLVEICQTYKIGEPLRPELGGRDELTVIDHEFRAMVGKIDSATKNERNILNNVSDVIAFIGTDGTIKHCNRQASVQWSVQAGDRYESLLINESAAQFHKFLDSCTRANDVAEIELPLMTSEGTIQHRVRATYEPKERGFFIVARDIREEVEREEARHRVMSMVGHDLRAPLQSVRVALGAVSDGVYGAITKTGVTTVNQSERAIDTVLASLRELLDFEKMQSGKLELERTDCDLLDVVYDALAQFPEIDEPVILPESESERLFVRADSVRLRSSFISLFQTVRSLGGQCVELALSQRDKEIRVTITFKLAEPVSGISHIFDRYASGLPEGLVSKGSQLTLPLTRAMIRSHGGEVTAEATSEDHRTVCMRIVLPLNYSDQDNAYVGQAPDTVLDAQPATQPESDIVRRAEPFWKQLEDKVFSVTAENPPPLSIIGWWEARRTVYNLAVFAAAIPGLVVYFTNFRVNWSALAMATLIWLVSANLGYCFGAWIEISARKLRIPVSTSFAPDLLRLGILFAIGLTAIEAFMTTVIGVISR